MKSVAFNERVYDLPYIAEPERGVSVYLDLRTHPTKIDEIPELKGEPRLQPLVRILNDPRGRFMTHGCAIGADRPGVKGSTVIRIPYGAQAAPFWYSSYVIFSSWFFDQNNEEHSRAIYESYPSDRNAYNIAFEVQSAYFLTPYERAVERKWSETNGTVCGIWISGWGSNAKEAGDKWSAGIKDLISFFENLPSGLSGPSARTGITLSQHMFLE